MSTGDSDRLLRVQTVLYHADHGQIWRLLHGLDAAARHAVAEGAVGKVEWAIGDSSPTPTLGDADVDGLRSAASALVNVSYEFFDANLGSSGGQNRLAHGAASELLFVLNPDTYPAPTAVTELVRAIDRGGVGIADARQIPLEHPKVYEQSTGETSWASGCCMMVHARVFQDLGGFDSQHFLLHCDDVDFSWRVRALGRRVVTAPRAVVFHDKRPSNGEPWPAPEHELYHAVLGRLILATRWGRPDIVGETIEAVEAGGSDVQRRAVDEYRARAVQGRLPAMAGDTSAAEFVGGEYAVHRV